MKSLFLTGIIALLLTTGSAVAQKKAEVDNGTRLTVVRTEKTTGRNREIHFTITSISGVAVDFSLFTQLNSGSWNVSHHLDLAAGATYEDVSGFTGVTGKYIIYSAPHSDWASFPFPFEINKIIAANPAVVQSGNITAAPAPGAPATTAGATAGASPAGTAPVTPNPASNTPASPPPTKDNSAPPVPPPM